MSTSNTLLHGKKVIIIGGSSGIGHGVAAAALSNGASVVISSSSKPKVDAAVERLKQNINGEDGITVAGEAFDIRDYSALTGFLTKEAPFDHLVITAGDVPKRGPSKQGVDLREELQSSFDIRYWGAMNAAHHIHANGLIRRGGSFTMTIGTQQARPSPGVGFGIGVAGAIETATRGLALDLKPLRVNTISPGLVDTELIQQLPEELRTALVEKIGPKLLVGHVGTPEEVAEAYIFAMKARWILNGLSYKLTLVITVDGGGVLV
ncbi:NAD(P)-binding protein [Ceratobasidium sp. AG-I]|nr:NAD(P)-binding protein [Ceratobasidium sp. AG-I]